MAATILQIVARIGGSCGICIMSIYIGELFPTSIRQLALGTANAFAALVGIMAPFVGGPMVGIFLTNTWRNYNVIVTLKRRRDIVLT